MQHIALVSLISLLCSFDITPLAYQMLGAIRGEASYRAYPTSFWKREILLYPRYCNFEILSGPAIKSDRIFLGAPWIRSSGYLPLRSGDTMCIPVLLELLKDDNAYVRSYSIDTLGRFGRRARSALPQLRKLIRDEDICAFGYSVGEKATDAIRRIEKRRPPVKKS
jgi:HEAT repeats